MKKVITRILSLSFTFSLILYSCSDSQPLKVGSFKLYDYSTILKDLARHGKKSNYMVHLDYEAMMYLDTASFKVLKTVNPDFIEEHDIDTANIFFTTPESYIREVPVDFIRIEQLFSNNDTLKNTILRLKNVNLDDRNKMKIQNNIYIKDHQKAIITINVGTWTISYRLVLKDKKLRFEELYQIIE